jgi:V/A-type H+/Na+-transporting ATPase subunit E
MESLQIMTQTIVEEAKEHAEQTIQDAKKSLENVFEKQRLLGIQKANEEMRSILRKSEEEAEIYRANIIAESTIKANWAVLQKKELWISSVIDEVRNRLIEISKLKKYIRTLERLIIEAGVALDGGELDIILNQNDSNLNLNLDKLSKSISEKTGAETKLELSSEKANIIGGALLRTVDGKIIMDNSFEDIIKRQEKELRNKIAKVLFS